MVNIIVAGNVTELDDFDSIVDRNDDKERRENHEGKIFPLLEESSLLKLADAVPVVVVEIPVATYLLVDECEMCLLRTECITWCISIDFGVGMFDLRDGDVDTKLSMLDTDRNSAEIRR